MRPVDRRLAVGDFWFILMPEATAVVKAEILDITGKTVAFRIHRKHELNQPGDFDIRFRADDVDYIEFISNTQVKLHPFLRETKS